MANNHPALINHTLPEGKTWLRASEVGDYLDLSKATVFRLVQRGIIPARRFGGSIRILRADILAFENGAAPSDQSADSTSSECR